MPTWKDSRLRRRKYPYPRKIIDINADAILISPFQNSGGYGRLDEWGNPIIETADYMETSALGRAEWMKFYGMLFGVEDKADSMFNDIEKRYNELVKLARTSTVSKSVLVDKIAGPYGTYQADAALLAG